MLQPGTCSTCTHPKIRYIPEGGEVDAPKCTGTSGSMTIQSEAAKDVSSSVKKNIPKYRVINAAVKP